MTGWQKWWSRNYDTIRAGELAYSFVTIVAIVLMVCIFYFGRLLQTLDDMGTTVDARLRSWHEITNYIEYLNSADYSQAPTPLIENVKSLIGRRLADDDAGKEAFSRRVAAAEAGALGLLYPHDVADLKKDDIRASISRFVADVARTPPHLLEARFAGMEPADSVLIFSRKALLPLEHHLTVLRSIRSHLNSLRSPLERASALLLLISIWGVWLVMLRPALQRSLDLQSRLEASERRARITLASIGEAVLVVGPDGTVTTANPMAETLLGSGQGGVTGHTLSELIRFTGIEHLGQESSDLVEVFGPARRRVSRRSGIANLPNARSEGARLIDMTAAPIAASGGIDQGGVIVLRDVTSEQRMLEQLHNSDKARAVVGLAAALAHEFNNTLAVISGAQELMSLKLGKFQECSKLVSHHLTAIKGAVKQSNGLTGQLLAIGSQASLSLEPVNVMAPLLAAISNLKRSSKQPVIFALNAQLKHAECFVNGDSASLQRVFMALGMNSLQAVGAGGEISVVVKSSTTARRRGLLDLGNDANTRAHLEVEWRDNGCGIAESDLKRIFEPFFTTRAADGAAGLGLSIVRGIIVEHRGAIVAASTPGEGTVFTIYLPVCEKPEAPRLASGSSAPVSAPDSIHALIAEDEGAFAELLRDYLTANGIRVDVACNGTEAIEMFKREHTSIDIVVLDLNMPGKSGQQVEAVMRALDPTCRIIVSTGHLDPGERAKDGLHDTTVVLRKPYALHELLAAIHAAMATERG